MWPAAMWSTVLVMAVVAATDPLRVGVVAYMLSRSRPMRLLVPFFLVAFAANIAVGAAVVFGFKNANRGDGQNLPPAVEIGIGVVGVLIAALSATGVLERLVNRFRSRRALPVGELVGEGPAPVVESQTALSRLPSGLQAALRGESAWAAAALGLTNGFPTPYYLAAMAAALTSRTPVAEQMLALVVFNVIGFGVALAPIISFWLAPAATRAGVERVYAWMRAHHRLVVTAIAGVVGVFFLSSGLSHL